MNCKYIKVYIKWLNYFLKITCIWTILTFFVKKSEGYNLLFSSYFFTNRTMYLFIFNRSFHRFTIEPCALLYFFFQEYRKAYCRLMKYPRHFWDNIHKSAFVYIPSNNHLAVWWKSSIKCDGDTLVLGICWKINDLLLLRVVHNKNKAIFCCTLY